MQTVTIDLHSETILKEKNDNVKPHIFLFKIENNILTHIRYPQLRTDAFKTTYFFGSAYTGEHIFSRVQIVKSKTKIRFTDTHIENSLKFKYNKMEKLFSKRTISIITLKIK